VFVPLVGKAMQAGRSRWETRTSLIRSISALSNFEQFESELGPVVRANASSKYTR
jgi:hypothetical protein